MNRFPSTHHRPWPALLASLLVSLPGLCLAQSQTNASTAAQATNPAQALAQDASTRLPAQLRSDMATIGRYADTVRQQLSGPTSASAAGAASVASVASVAGIAGNPEKPATRLDQLLDPFAVSPQLRDERHGPGSGSYRGLPSATRLDIQRQVRVKAVLVTPRSRATQLEITSYGYASRAQGNDYGNALLVMDGELVDLGDLGVYVVHIDPHNNVTLAQPGSPQSARITLR